MVEAAKNMAVIGEEASFSGLFKGHDLVVLGRFEGQIGRASCRERVFRVV